MCGVCCGRGCRWNTREIGGFFISPKRLKLGTTYARDQRRTFLPCINNALVPMLALSNGVKLALWTGGSLRASLFGD